MPYDVEETGNLTRIASFTIPQNEYQKDVDKALRKLSGRVKVRGFRKGKVPIGVLRKKYGGTVRQDVVESLISRHVDQIIEETDDILHLEQPRVTKFNENGVGLEFVIEFELRPDVDPIGYKGIEVEKPAVEIDSAAIDAELEKLRRQFSTLEPIPLRQTIKEGDVVTFDFRALDEDDPDIADFQGEDAQITIGDGNALPGMEEALIGSKFDATVTTTVEPGPTYQIEHLQDKTFDIEMKIKSVKQRVLPDLDDDFAADTGEAETLLELRGKVRDSLAQQREHEAKHFAENELVQSLMETNEFDLPPRFVRRQIDRKIQQQMQQLQQQGLDVSEIDLDFDEVRESLREETEDQIRTEFLLLAIAKKENLEVDDQDLQNYIAHQAMHSDVSPEQMIRWYQQDRNRLQQAAGNALLEKTVNYLLGEAEIKEIEWPDDEEFERRATERAKKSAERAAKNRNEKEMKEATGGVPKAEPKTDQPAAAPDSVDAAEAFEAKTVSELKDLLREHDLKVSGKKTELVERLVEAGVTPPGPQ